MTRDEFEKAIKKVGVSSSAEIYFANKEALLAYDAEQRLVIELLKQELGVLKHDDAERCTLIRDMEEEERRKDAEIEEARRTAEYWKAEHLAGNTKIEQQAQQIATLKSELSQRTNLEGSAPCWNSAHMKQIATLRQALMGILEIGKRDMTNPKYDGYFEQAKQALEEPKQ